MRRTAPPLSNLPRLELNKIIEETEQNTEVPRSLSVNASHPLADIEEGKEEGGDKRVTYHGSRAYNFEDEEKA